MKTLRKLVPIILILFIILFNSIPVLSQSISGVSNNYLSISVNDQGRFTIGTTQDSADSSINNTKKLLYGHPDPGTSYTTFRIDEENFIFSSNVQTPLSNSVFNTNVSEGNFKNISIKQVLSIVKNDTTQLNDTVEIKYIVTNRDNVIHNVGTRIMMDTMLGDNDAAPFRVPEVGPLTTESEFTSSQIPNYWQAFDSLSNPSVIAHGNFLNVPIKPDKVQFLNWSKASQNSWEVPLNLGAPNGDSAVNVFWLEKPLQPGETKEYTTYYGLSNFISNERPPVTLNVSGPSIIKFDGENYLTNPFSLSVYLGNISQTYARDLQLRVILPEGITTPNPVVDVGDLNANQEKMETLNLKIDDGRSFEGFDVKLILSGSNIEEKEVTKHIIVENVQNLVLDSLQVVPNQITLKEGESKYITTLGHYSDGTIKDLTQYTSGTTYEINESGVATISKNGLLTVLDNTLRDNFIVTVRNGDQSAQCQVNISKDPILTGISVTPLSAELERGKSAQMTVTATMSNGETKDVTGDSLTTYKSLDTNRLTVGAGGDVQVQPNAPTGEAGVTISYGGKSKTVIIKVINGATTSSISVTPLSAELERGKSAQMTVTATMSNGETKDVTGDSLTTYKSLDTNRLTVGAGGDVQVQPNAPTGEAGVTISYGGKSKTVIIKVINGATTSSISVTPLSAELERGKSAQMTVTATMSNGETKDVTGDSLTTYKSLDTNRLTVGAGGDVQVQPNAPTGEAGVTISYGGKSKTVIIKVINGATTSSISVTPLSAELERGKSAQMTVTATMSNGETKDVTGDSLTTYKSLDTNRLTVGAGGEVQVQPNAPTGEAGVTISYGGKSKTVIIKVINGATTSSISVTPLSAELERGKSAQMTVTATMSNGETKDVTGDSLTTYKSLDTNRLTVGAGGEVQVQPNAPTGEAGVTISYGGKSKTVIIKVINGATTSSISVTPLSAELERGKSAQMTVTATMSNGETKDVTGDSLTTYKSLDTNRLTVEAGGEVQVQPNAPTGEAGVTISYGGKSKTIIIKVVNTN